MKINKKLNLVVPVETDTGFLYVHSMPITREVFEKYFLVISKAFTVIYNEGLTVTAGPRVAAMMLRTVAEKAGVWDGSDGVENGLMNEIRRLTNIIVPTAAGWSTIPFSEAKDFLDPDDVSEVEGQIVFFILNSAMHKRSRVEAILTVAANFWGSLITSSNVTEYQASLPTSTTGASIGAKETPSFTLS